MNKAYNKIIDILIETKKCIIEGETTGGNKKKTMDRVNKAIISQRDQDRTTNDSNAFLASREGQRRIVRNFTDHPSVRAARRDLQPKTKPILRSRKGVGELEARGWKRRKEANRDSFALERAKRIKNKIENRKVSPKRIALAKKEADDADHSRNDKARIENLYKELAWKKGEIAAPRSILRQREKDKNK